MRSIPFPAILLLFFASGATALCYETVWVRQLSLSFGITVHAISAVLVAYMFGLSLGARLVGRWADTLDNPLKVYGFFEIAIAAYAFLNYYFLTNLMPWVSRAIYGFAPESPLFVNATRFLVAFVLLVTPTILMGGTLPLLGRLFTRTEETTGAYLGRLYGLNTLGAVLGTAVAGFWLIMHVGIYYTTIAAVVVNLVVGAIAIVLSRNVSVSVAPTPAVPAAEPESSARLENPRLVYFVIFLSGYSALAYQVMWNRTLTLYVHNSIYAFSAILMVFLLGIALGSLAFSRNSVRWSNPRTLAIVQISLGVYVWLSLYLTGLIPSLLKPVAMLFGFESWLAALATIFGAAGIVVFVPTFLMGITFPLATSLGTQRAEEVGARIGGFYAINTLGNILGSFVTGFILIELIGVRNAFVVAITCNLLGGFLLLFRSGSRALGSTLAAGLATAAGVVLILVTVARELFRSQFEKAIPGEILFYKEEITDTVMVYERKDGSRVIRYSDGRGTAGTETDTVNRIYGHLPMILHPNPDRVLSIGFGVGNTLSALGMHDSSRILLIELANGVIEAAPYFPTNQNVLETPNLELKFEDGRNFLVTTDEEFDIVQLEPPEIHTASVVNLYTKEFYELAKERMADGAIMCQWLNVILMPEYEMKMLLRTFMDAFPHSSLWTGGEGWDIIMIGSEEPIELRPEDLKKRFARKRARPDLERMGLESPQALLSYHILSPDSLDRYLGDVPSITDDWTYVDFSVPQQSESGYGVFLYRTHMAQDRRGDPANQERYRQRWEMMANRESAAYLIDDEGLDAEERTRFFELLDRETQKQRRESALALQGYDSTERRAAQ